MAFEAELVGNEFGKAEWALHGRQPGESREEYTARRKAEMIGGDIDTREAEQEAAAERARAQARGHYPVHESVAS